MGTRRLAVLTSLLSVVAVCDATASIIDPSSLVRVGTAQIVSGNILRLTDTTDPTVDDITPGPAPAGAAWTSSRYDVANPFSVSFDFQMWNPTGHLDNDGSGGDGIAFLIQNSAAGTSALGVGSGGMGFLGIENSVAVMFDSYQNNYYYGDPSGHYIAVNTRGIEANVPHHFCSAQGQLTGDPAQGTDLPDVTCLSNPALGLSNPIPFDDGAVHHATLLYTPGLLDIYLDSLPVLSVMLNLQNTLNLANGTDAFLGFTAGTRYSYQDQDIRTFDYTVTPEPATGALCLIGFTILASMAWRKSRA